MSSEYGINRLARTIQTRVKEVSTKPAAIDIATVDSGGSMRIDAYGLTIEKDEISRIQVGEEKVTYMTGDRVVIAYAGDDIIVLGKLV